MNESYLFSKNGKKKQHLSDLKYLVYVVTIEQAVEDVNRGLIKTGDKLYELKSMQDSGKKIEVSV